MKKVRIKVKGQRVRFSIHDKGRARERYFFYIEMLYNQELRFGLSEDIEVLEAYRED